MRSVTNFISRGQGPAVAGVVPLEAARGEPDDVGVDRDLDGGVTGAVVWPAGADVLDLHAVAPRPAIDLARQPHRHPRDPSAQERPPRWLTLDGKNPQMAHARRRWLRSVGRGQLGLCARRLPAANQARVIGRIEEQGAST